MSLQLTLSLLVCITSGRGSVLVMRRVHQQVASSMVECSSKRIVYLSFYKWHMLDIQCYLNRRQMTSRPAGAAYQPLTLDIKHVPLVKG
uniref:Putative secreted protein n=1 Tax=Amblyomma cajennense TaxID=34607 RepID=A0A023FDK3_AMBCJ